MPRKSTIVLVVLALVVFVAAARGGGTWLIHKVRVMHGGH